MSGSTRGGVTAWRVMAVGLPVFWIGSMAGVPALAGTGFAAMLMAVIMFIYNIMRGN